MRVELPLLLCCCLAVSALAQTEVSGWKLPAGGFVELVRTRKLEPPHVPDGLLGPETVAGFHSFELGKGGELDYPASDFRDLPVLIGWSLAARRLSPGQKTRVDRTLARVFPLPQVRVRGTFTAGAEAGGVWTETGEFEFQSLPLPEVKNAQRVSFERMALRGEVQKGRLQIERTVDPAAGRVLTSKARMAFTLAVTPLPADGAGPRLTTVTFEETLTLGRVLEPRYAGFQGEVDKAIERGVRYLKGKLADPNERRFEPVKDGDGRTLNAGFLALVVLTLLKAETAVDDPAVRKAMDELRRRELADTYSLAAALMAMEALYAPANEREQLLQGLIKEPRERKPAEADRRLMEGWVRQLLKNTDQTVDRGYRLRFSYLPQPRFDNSNTQYAALGLYSALLCGVAVEPAVWNGLAEHFLRDQRKPEGAAAPLSLLTYRELAARQEGKAPTRAPVLPLKGRGWAYTPDQEPCSSMTCAGVTVLTLVEAALAGKGAGSALAGNLDAAIRAGLAWLHEHYTVRANAGKLREWYGYALYSLERACELGGIARLGEHDWYFDGCMQLLHQQGQDGGFPTIEDTCFAVLFLKKAQLPVRTGPR